MRAGNFCGGLGIVEVEAADRWRRGQALRQLRVQQHHLTQEQLAFVLGISLILLSDIECGRADIPTRSIGDCWRHSEEASLSCRHFHGHAGRDRRGQIVAGVE
jgi:hypothetical protein